MAKYEIVRDLKLFNSSDELMRRTCYSVFKKGFFKWKRIDYRLTFEEAEKVISYDRTPYEIMKVYDK